MKNTAKVAGLAALTAVALGAGSQAEAHHHDVQQNYQSNYLGSRQFLGFTSHFYQGENVEVIRYRKEVISLNNSNCLGLKKAIIYHPEIVNVPTVHRQVEWRPFEKGLIGLPFRIAGDALKCLIPPCHSHCKPLPSIRHKLHHHRHHH